MEYARLGESGLYVSKIILGTTSFGSSRWQDWVLNEEDALPLLNHAFDTGINTWDTEGLPAHLYPDRQRPIASLMDKKQPDLVNRVGLTRKHILSAISESVRRLGTYIDVLQIHRFGKDVNPAEVMRVLNDVVESGQVRYIGASSMSAWEFQKLQYIADKNGWHKFISMQNYYNLLYREEKREMIPFCRDCGIGLLPWSPLARGVLDRPWTERSTFREQTDKLLQGLVRDSATGADREVIQRVTEIAEKRNCTMATVALAWCLQQGMYPITSLGNVARIDSISFELWPSEVRYIEEPCQPKNVTY